MITQQQRTLIDQTLPAVEANALKITSTFYPLMFGRYPQVLNYFNQANQARGTQRHALANAVVTYAKHLDALDKLGERVSLIAHKHCSLGIKPEHYPIVGECLLAAIAEVLGDAVNDDILNAWGAAYQQLANILIDVERDIYQRQHQRTGGWEGFEGFTVIGKVAESEVITSLVLQAKDQRIIDFEPGQYITLLKAFDGLEHRRNYSLSDKPGKTTLRISVKREPDGVWSNHLHDEVSVGDVLQISAPYGDFVLRDSHKPMVLVTAGVGITPAISMLAAAISSHQVAGRDIHFIHCARNGAHHAFDDYVQQVEEMYPEVKKTFIYSDPTDEDIRGEQGSADAFGLLNESHLQQHLGSERDVECYVLGPKPFMHCVLGMASRLGIPDSQVHYEFFGPLEEIQPVSSGSDQRAELSVA